MADFFDTYDKHVLPAINEARKPDDEEDLLYADEEDEKPKKNVAPSKKYEWEDAMFEDPEFMRTVAEKLALKAEQENGSEHVSTTN